MKWFKRILAYLSDCVHPQTAWPRRHRAGFAYVACLDCVSGLPYSLARSWRIWIPVLSVATLGVEAVGEDSQPATVNQSHVVSSTRGAHMIVVGFMGGFIHRDDAHHPEVRLVRELHEEFPAAGYFRIFENRSLYEAYRSIVREWNIDEGDRISNINTRDTRIILFGHSWGASAVVRLARKLDHAGIPVALTIHVDSVATPSATIRSFRLMSLQP